MSTLADASKEGLIQILTSPVVALQPSNSEKVFTIHEPLLSVSPSLLAACKKSWEESKEKKYKFKKYDEAEGHDDCFVEVTEEMLACFISWAYLGDYTTGVVSVFSAKEKGAMVVAPEPEIQEPVDEIDSFGWGSFTTTKKDKKKRERPPARGWVTDKVEESVPIFQNLILEEVAVDEGPVKDIKEECVPLATEDAGVPVAEGANASSSSSKGKEPEITTPSTNHSYITPPEPLHPLYLHIQLYVFSHIYLIKPLTALASTKIKTHLQKSHQTSTRNITTETFDLLEYAFSNLPEKNELLEWLARYSSWKLGELREESGRLERLLEIEGGKFAKAMVRHVLSGKKVAFV